MPNPHPPHLPKIDFFFQIHNRQNNNPKISLFFWLKKPQLFLRKKKHWDLWLLGGPNKEWLAQGASINSR
jgi:hypothetical protein